MYRILSLPITDTLSTEDRLKTRDLGQSLGKSVGGVQPRPPNRGSAEPSSKRTRLSLNTEFTRFSNIARTAASPVEVAERERREKLAESCLNASMADSTRRTYESALNATVRGAERAVGVDLPPIDSGEKIMAILSDMTGAPWASIRVNLSAVKAWHVARGLESTFNAAWTARALAFWNGLIRLADHTSSEAKRPLRADELLSYVEDRLVSPTCAGERDAAVAMICFFGIRRISESPNLRRRDVTLAEGHVIVHVRKQKNDPNGKGMNVFIPSIPSWGGRCPCKIVTSWVHRWGTVRPKRHVAAALLPARETSPHAIVVRCLPQVAQNCMRRERQYSLPP